MSSRPFRKLHREGLEGIVYADIASKPDPDQTQLIVLRRCRVCGQALDLDDGPVTCRWCVRLGLNI